MILIAALFFKEQAAAWFSKKFGLKNGNGVSTPKWAADLTEHVNHTQTDILERIAEGVEKLDFRGENQCKKLDVIIRNQEDSKDDDAEWRRESRETMRDIIRKV